MRHHPCWQDLLRKNSWSVEQFAQARAYLSKNERIHHGFNFSKLMNKHGTPLNKDDNVATQTSHHCWNCMKFPIVWRVSYLIWLSFLCANHAMPQCLDGRSHSGWAKIDAHEGNICSLKSHLEDCGLIDLLALIILGNKVRSVRCSGDFDTQLGTNIKHSEVESILPKKWQEMFAMWTPAHEQSCDRIVKVQITRKYTVNTTVQHVTCQ